MRQEDAKVGMRVKVNPEVWATSLYDVKPEDFTEGVIARIATNGNSAAIAFDKKIPGYTSDCHGSTKSGFSRYIVWGYLTPIDDEIKVGDTVKCIRAVDWLEVGDLGVVIKIKDRDVNDQEIGVDWHCHPGKGHAQLGAEYNGWWMIRNQIKKSDKILVPRITTVGIGVDPYKEEPLTVDKVRQVVKDLEKMRKSEMKESIAEHMQKYIHDQPLTPKMSFDPPSSDYERALRERMLYLYTPPSMLLEKDKLEAFQRIGRITRDEPKPNLLLAASAYF